MIEIIKNTIRFILLILLQVWVFNRIDISLFLSPMIIVSFILFLPFPTHKWILLVASFFLGLIVDIFMNTPGILSFTAVFVAYIRPVVLRILQPRDGYVINTSPRVSDLGWNWFFQYSTILTFVFHLIYFIILGFSQDNFLVILWKTIISSAFTLLFIFMSQIFSTQK